MKSLIEKISEMYVNMLEAKMSESQFRSREKQADGSR